MKNKKSRKILLLLVLLLVVSVGFALLSRQLNIFGLSNISASKWLIHWDNVANEDGMRPKTHAYIKDLEKKIVEYEVEFDTPGQYYEFTVDAVNEGTMDADLVEVISKVNGQDISTLPVYIVYSVTYDDGTDPTIGDILPKKVGDIPGRQTYKVKIKYDENLLTNELYESMPNELNYTFTFSVKYGQDGVAPGDFSTDPWEEVEVIGNEAAEQETTDGSCGDYNIGDTKVVYMDFDGDDDPEMYTIRIANCSTPPECKTEGFSQTACGFVLEFVDIVTKHRINDAQEHPIDGNYVYGGWEHSDMRAYLNNGLYVNANSYTSYTTDYKTTGFISKMPSELQDVLANTKVVSGYGCVQRSGITCSVPDNGGNNFDTTDKVYLLSAKEIWGDKAVSYPIKYDSAINATRQLDYYELAGVTSDSPSYAPAIKKYTDGRAGVWWTRTPHDNDWSLFYDVGDVGIWYNNGPQFSSGVSPAFKLK